MTGKTTLLPTTLLAVLFLTVHLADDIVRGTEAGGASNLLAIPIAVTWLCGASVLAGRRSGYVITLLGSLLGVAVPGVHFLAPGGAGGGGVASSDGALLFVWTLVALGVAAAFGLVLSVLGLWRSFASRVPS